MLSHSFRRQDSHQVAAEFSHKLNLIKESGERWQVDFVPTKSQAMVVSQSCAASREVEGRVKFGDPTLPLQDHIKIL
ncbi:hypothetical protein E2C01_088901 [Portunus trituberculatus]|uniref:Uncharacterized protein n=1 Tax=Portunus trituberculatus TaxID=210409 RepID=A0A5B7JAK1_PORTR|nr:hypothetical protein [Portunus trituberculatus]